MFDERTDDVFWTAIEHDTKRLRYMTVSFRFPLSRLAVVNIADLI